MTPTRDEPGAARPEQAPSSEPRRAPLAPPRGPRFNDEPDDYENYRREAGDPGWARGAGALGIVTTGLIIITGTGSAVTAETLEDEFDDDEVNLPALVSGGTATLLGTILIPVIASGGNSASVRGSTALRIVGWVGYGLFMLNAWGMVGAGSAGAYVPSAAIAGATLLGTATTVAFTVDAFFAASAATEVRASLPTLRPSILTARLGPGRRIPTIGLSIRL